MNTHEALRFAESIGLFTGWIITENPQPLLEGLLEGQPAWVSLAEMFVERRIVQTEGMVSGTVVFTAAVPADGDPPKDRSLITWAEELGHPWLLAVDNECAYWGGLGDIQIDALLRWFVCRHPSSVRWQEVRFTTDLARRLQRGLFEHGWSINHNLVGEGRSGRLDLWAGCHERCILEHPPTHRLSALNTGLRLTLRTATWTAEAIDEEDCPIDDITGRVSRQPLA
ncbi:MAG: hypothetical protein EA402_10400 [Planctomycetota bacterium]|nr:MAG: hypothetical protein EA402_10400 [Planctomycetota bacterium]